ncbi:MAG: tetratricopeptide repeat protein [Calditrichae bacterium]|nr:tetratricopeptide repeat protein [Calditrichia bacterium]
MSRYYALAPITRRAFQLGFFLLSMFWAVSMSASDRDFSIKNLYKIDSGHSYIGFQVKYMGFAKVRGRFQTFSGSLYYDPADITKTSATVIINTESINTGLEWRDNDLKSANWFDAAKYPNIQFQTTHVKQTNESLMFLGQLTMHGITKEVGIKLHENSGVLEDSRGDSQVILTGTTTLNRQDFGVKGERWSGAVSDEVEIELTVLGKRINADNFRNWVRNKERPQGKIYKTVSESGVAAGLAEFDKMKTSVETEVTATALNIVGYMLLKEGKVKDAIAVFEHNRSSFPDEADVYDSLGEAYLNADNSEKATANFRKALQRNPQNANAIEILRHLSSH